MVAGTLVPGVPEDGLIPVIAGGAGEVTVKPVNGGDVPIPVVTVSVRVSVDAPPAIVTVIGRLVAVPVPMVAVTPLPLNVTAVAPFRFVPLMVAGTLVPGVPEDGLIPVIAGGAGEVTVKPVNGRDVPIPVVTVSVRVSVDAPPAIVTVIGRLVAVPVPMVAVTPLPLNVTAVAPPRPVPLMVAGWLVPAAPEDGVIPVTTGSPD